MTAKLTICMENNMESVLTTVEKKILDESLVSK